MVADTHRRCAAQICAKCLKDAAVLIDSGEGEMRKAARRAFAEPKTDIHINKDQAVWFITYAREDENT